MTHARRRLRAPASSIETEVEPRVPASPDLLLLNRYYMVAHGLDGGRRRRLHTYPELPRWTWTHGVDGQDATTDQKVGVSSTSERAG